ncbi:MAG: NAD(+) synthase [Candidatus Nanohaloarchaeota archaeon QJJ-5]|nr:NAD(+) synthase [Candidatus Nanohaloarchaeota archaeon QJJ-5]
MTVSLRVSENPTALYDEEPLSLARFSQEQREHIIEQAQTFLSTQCHRAEMDGYVIGISGGIDSATTLALAVEAVGSENVVGVSLPASHSDEQDVRDARQLCEELGVQWQNATADHPFEHVIDKLEQMGKPLEDEEMQRIKRGNIISRCRMIILRDIAKANNALVAGTTNASERLLGYMTLAGDGRGGIDSEVLDPFLKTTVYQMAEDLSIPLSIREKEPTADLWADQTDAKELGADYGTIDTILIGQELGFDSETITEKTGYSHETVKAVFDQREATAFKREPVPVFRPDL